MYLQKQAAAERMAAGTLGRGQGAHVRSPHALSQSLQWLGKR